MQAFPNTVTTGLPHAFFNARVQRALAQLNEELKVLGKMSQNLSHTPVEPEVGFTMAPLRVTSANPDDGAAGQLIAVFWQSFELGAGGAIPGVQFVDRLGYATQATAFLRSDQCLAVTVPAALSTGT